MFVINRHGEKEHFDFTKTHDKIANLSTGLNVNVDLITQNVISVITNGIKTSDIDTISANIAYQLSLEDFDYQVLAYRILDNNLRKDTPDWEEYLNNPKIRDDIKDKLRQLVVQKWDMSYIGLFTLKDAYLLCNDDSKVVERPEFLLARVACEIASSNSGIKNSRGKASSKTTVLGNGPQKVLNMMLEGRICHSSPTLFNAGTRNQQMTSCFVFDMDDSVDGITKTKRRAIMVAAQTGGVGINLSHIRMAGSLIKTTGKRKAVGLGPILESINSDFLIITQGGRRNASCVVWNTLWHPEFELFLFAKNEKSPIRAKELFYGIWMSDEFMRRVRDNEDWHFVSDDLTGLYGQEFVDAYSKANVVSTIKARDLWTKILLEQCGNRQALFICHGDQVNKCSNLKNIGYIPCSNLCTEIMQPFGQIKHTKITYNLGDKQIIPLVDEEKYRVVTETVERQTTTCNLGSVALPKCVTKYKERISRSTTSEGREIGDIYFIAHNRKYDPDMVGDKSLHKANIYKSKLLDQVNQVDQENKGDNEVAFKSFDYKKLKEAVFALVDNINNIIDKNKYLTNCTRASSFHYRPMGIGIQGLNDLFVDLGLPFHSEDAHILAANVAEAIHFYSIKRSNQLAKSKIDIYAVGGDYGAHDDFEGSDLSKGIFHWQHYFAQEDKQNTSYCLLRNWPKLRASVCAYGTYNGTFNAYMPTVSACQLWQNSPSFEQYTSLIYKRPIGSKEFIIIIPRLFKALKKIGLWVPKIVEYIKLFGMLPGPQASLENVDSKLIGDTNNVVTNNKLLTEEENRMLETIRPLFKTAYEEKHNLAINLVSVMQPFVDQGLSFNWFLTNPTPKEIGSYYNQCWKKGIKTWNYYYHRGGNKKTIKLVAAENDCGCSL